ncbi:hypothetical protein L593_07545 [Salinarchaeum sp. Harcht-Bsk1]|uniref:OapC/ArvC family zinc-ribbon domain-containing protein n=1 Tax=Salinarchaeum sp. Harcht-Bsk1 TaxID=1333523 RepID=UPI00034235AB|nr:Zn-ribbon containing protein [Salinarchaeum sp. Harcht-Bsk1]AGN01454.1 hypothetical protein L593_07545 [Salinarchaeum sp. Harcht-Bsk1]
MPHQCTGCGHVFPDGSKEMLSGCPDCGGNKFQFQPSSATGGGDPAGGADAGAAPSEEPPEPPEPPSPGGSVAETVAGAAQSVKNMVGSGNSEPERASAGATGDGPSDHEWPAVGREDATPKQPSEDAAQAGARSATVSPDELPDHDVVDSKLADSEAPEPASTAEEGALSATASEAADAEEPGSAPFTGSGDREKETPDLSELRAELNDQFESIKIVERGQYELNLMELYDREEYIISLMEDGRYAIEVPETWRGDS